jgi:hypothetical protein
MFHGLRLASAVISIYQMFLLLAWKRAIAVAVQGWDNRGLSPLRARTTGIFLKENKNIL